MLVEEEGCEGRLCSYFTLTWVQFSSVKKKYNKKKFPPNSSVLFMSGCLQAQPLCGAISSGPAVPDFPSPAHCLLLFSIIDLTYFIAHSPSCYHRGIVLLCWLRLVPGSKHCFLLTSFLWRQRWRELYKTVIWAQAPSVLQQRKHSSQSLPNAESGSVFSYAQLLSGLSVNGRCCLLPCGSGNSLQL